MYNNIGNKVKLLAQIIGGILLAAGIIVWFSMVCGNTRSRDDLTGWIALIVGVFGFVSSWFIYAFGQLVDDTAAIRSSICKTEKEKEKESAE